MSIIDELLEMWKKSETDEQLKVICDQITKEEVPNKELYEGPYGANMFLSLPLKMPVDPRQKYDHYVCLEREAQKKYIVSHWTCLTNSTTTTPKRQKAWGIKNDAPKKILKEFVERMQHLKGE